jgi:dipeptidyl aminopeptidase/acylaminoacyl peptidase
MLDNKWNEATFAEFVSVADPRISPDGNMVSYLMSRTNLDSDKNENTTVIRNLKTGEERFISDGLLARFSPDGKSAAYLKTNEKEGKTELWLLDTRTGDSRKLLDAKAITEVNWSPDGRKLLLIKPKKANDPHVLFEADLPFWFDGKGYSDREKTIFEVYDSQSGAKLEEHEMDFQGLPYFPLTLWHGDAIVYNRPSRSKPFTYSDICQIDSGGEKTLFSNTAFKAAASDGKYLVLLGKPEKKNHAEHNYLYLWDGKEITALTEKFGRDDVGLSYPKMDSKGVIYYTSTRSGRIQLTAIGRDGIERALVDEDAWVTGFDVSKDGKVVFVKENSFTPPEVFIYSEKENITKLTSYNELVAARLYCRPLKRVECSSVGGLKVEGWYLKPDLKDAQKAPAIVFIHGGPKGAYGHHFDPLAQALASKGYFVLYTNPRGSNGYDEEFALTISGKYGLEDSQDILNVLGELIRMEPSIDQNRIGVTGISGGGYLTNWMISHTNRFAAAISENGISNWFTHYAFSDIGFWFCKDLIGKDPLSDENYRLLSPIYLATRVTTPTMFIHSTEDYRCPLDQSLMFYQTLRDLNKEAYIAVFRKGSHVHSLLGSPVHRKKRHKLMLDFFDSKLVRKEPVFKPAL